MLLKTGLVTKNGTNPFYFCKNIYYTYLKKYSKYQKIANSHLIQAIAKSFLALFLTQYQFAY